MLFCLLGLLLAPVLANKAYLIRHGEKPADGGTGLSAQGEVRAECIAREFGPESDYNIGYILAQDYKSNGKRKRPYDTVKPLADELGLTVDHSCDRDDPKCVRKKVKKYSGGKNILICWEHDELTDIAEKLGVNDAPSYPDDRYDLIWTIDLDSNDREISQSTENCSNTS